MKLQYYSGVRGLHRPLGSMVWLDVWIYLLCICHASSFLTTIYMYLLKEHNILPSVVRKIRTLRLDARGIICPRRLLTFLTKLIVWNPVESHASTRPLTWEAEVCYQLHCRGLPHMGPQNLTMLHFPPVTQDSHGVTSFHTTYAYPRWVGIP